MRNRLGVLPKAGTETSLKYYVDTKILGESQSSQKYGKLNINNASSADSNFVKCFSSADSAVLKYHNGSQYGRVSSLYEHRQTDRSFESHSIRSYRFCYLNWIYETSENFQVIEKGIALSF